MMVKTLTLTLINTVPNADSVVTPPVNTSLVNFGLQSLMSDQKERER